MLGLKLLHVSKTGPSIYLMFLIFLQVALVNSIVQTSSRPTSSLTVASSPTNVAHVPAPSVDAPTSWSMSASMPMTTSSAVPSAAGDSSVRNCWMYTVAVVTRRTVLWVTCWSYLCLYGGHGGRWVGHANEWWPSLRRSQRSAVCGRCWGGDYGLLLVAVYVKLILQPFLHTLQSLWSRPAINQTWWWYPWKRPTQWPVISRE